MKIIIKKALGRYATQDSIGEIHLSGPLDTTACGLADEDYDTKSTNKKITCSTCLAFLAWAKSIAKIKE